MILASFGRYGRVGEQSTGLNLSRSSPSPEFESMTNTLFVDGAYLARTGHDLGLQASPRAAGRFFEGLERVGKATFAPGQAGDQDRPGAVVFGYPLQRLGRDRGLVDGQAERRQAAGRAVQFGLGSFSVPRAPQQRRPPVGTGEPEAPAQAFWQYPLGQDQCADRIGGRVMPGDRRRERKRARVYMRVVGGSGRLGSLGSSGSLGPFGSRPTRGGRHHGR